MGGMTRYLVTALAAGLLGFAIGWYCSPNKVANEAGLIRLIATQADEITVLKQIVETYKEALGEPDRTL